MATSQNKWARLMNLLQWEGVGEWELRPNDFKHNLPRFVEWFKVNVKYIPYFELADLTVQKAVVQYYLEDSDNTAPIFYQQKDKGVLCLQTLYNKEKQRAAQSNDRG